MSLEAGGIAGVRFSGDASLLETLRQEESVERGFGNAEALRAQGSVRTQLLASAVRVNEAVLPRLAGSFERIMARVGFSEGFEAYVYQEPGVNAFVTRGHKRMLVVLSSGAVNLLAGSELDFVIGHELGHAVFGHVDVPSEYLIATGGLAPRTCMRLRAWQRAAEISADRAGLECCGSLAAAASALFKTLSGLRLEGVEIDPEELAGQWDHLREEVVTEGAREHWQLSHPFAPLRMKAMILYWQARERGAAPGAGDPEIRRLLGVMDPEGGDEAGADPLLWRFLFWGGLYIALADRHLDRGEVERLQSVAPPGIDLATLVREPGFRPERCIEEFTGAVGERRRKLSPVELHRIVEGLIDVAAADGSIDESEVRALHRIGEELHLTGAACDLLVERFKQRGGS